MPCQQFPKFPNGQLPANIKGGPFDTLAECKEAIGTSGGCPCCSNEDCSSQGVCPKGYIHCTGSGYGANSTVCCPANSIGGFPAGCGDPADPNDPFFELGCANAVALQPKSCYCGGCRSTSCAPPALFNILDGFPSEEEMQTFIQQNKNFAEAVGGTYDVLFTANCEPTGWGYGYCLFIP